MFTTAKKPRQVVPRKAEIKTLPPPIQGLNDRDPLIGMQPTDALRLENFICRPYGAVMRPGYSEYATGLGSEPVDSLMSYVPAYIPHASALGPGNAFTALTADPTQMIDQNPLQAPPGSAIFAACNGSVYNITNGGTGPWTPEPVITGSYFSWQNFQNEGGSFLLAASDEGGYYIYSTGTGWTKVVQGTNPGEIDGLDPDLIIHITVWKNRIWFIEKGSTRGWYLPTNQITGTVKPWDFGTQFRRGGHLQTFANWTLDAGLGIDDHFVALSSEGDVVVYTGYDPDQAPELFTLKGVWFVGPLPNSQRCVDTYGGDLLIMSTRGVSRMSDIVRFGETQAAAVYQTTKINNTFARFVRNNKDLRQWQIFRVPGESLILFSLPWEANYRYTMLCQDENTQGWSVLYDHPCTVHVSHAGANYSGTMDGRVVNTLVGQVDDVKLATSQFKFINGRITPAYSQLDKPGLQKNASMLRLSMLGVRTPIISVTPLVDYYLVQQQYSPVLPNFDNQFGKWDLSLWDAVDATWAGGGVPLIVWIGVGASGFALTAQIDVTGYGGLSLNQLDWLYTTGGPL